MPRKTDITTPAAEAGSITTELAAAEAEAERWRDPRDPGGSCRRSGTWLCLWLRYGWTRHGRQEHKSPSWGNLANGAVCISLC